MFEGVKKVYSKVARCAVASVLTLTLLQSCGLVNADQQQDNDYNKLLNNQGLIMSKSDAGTYFYAKIKGEVVMCTAHHVALLLNASLLEGEDVYSTRENNISLVPEIADKLFNQNTYTGDVVNLRRDKVVLFQPINISPEQTGDQSMPAETTDCIDLTGVSSPSDAPEFTDRALADGDEMFGVIEADFVMADRPINSTVIFNHDFGNMSTVVMVGSAWQFKYPAQQGTSGTPLYTRDWLGIPKIAAVISGQAGNVTSASPLFTQTSFERQQELIQP